MKINKINLIYWLKLKFNIIGRKIETILCHELGGVITCH